MPCGGSSLQLFMGDDKKKNPVYKKKQGWEPIHQKYKASEDTSRHKLKKKTKVNNQQKLIKDPMQRGLMTTK
jgi:hypothetical protein